MKKSWIFLLFCSFFVYGGNAGVHSWHSYLQISRSIDDPLSYLNSLRSATGLHPFAYNSLLAQASQDHAFYNTFNQLTGHYQDSSYPYFTGVTPTQRAHSVGFNSSVSENISYSYRHSIDYKGSIDDLFSAIYHRFGFLSFSNDLVGFAHSTHNSMTAYVYKMANSRLENLCLSESNFTYGVFYTPCKDTTHKIEKNLYLEAMQFDNSPAYILWPYENYTDTPPVFYEESPDPLPDYSVSGYPVSVQFNPEFYPQGIRLNRFELFDANNQRVTNTRLLTHQTDQNQKFSEYEFALFPLERLQWGERYSAEVEYIDLYDNSYHTIEWNFQTRALTIPYYKLLNSNSTVQAKSNQTYALYLKPLDGNEYSNNFSYLKPADVAFDYFFIDLNTLAVTLDGDIGQSVKINFSNGRSVEVKISNEDNAIYTQPQELIQEESLEYKLKMLSSGWHLLGATENITNMEMFDDVKYLWIYSDGKWSVYSADENILQIIQSSSFKDSVITHIAKGQGFWVKK